MEDALPRLGADVGDDPVALRELLLPGQTVAGQVVLALLWWRDVIRPGSFRRAGLLRVTTIPDLFSMSEILATQPQPRGPAGTDDAATDRGRRRETRLHGDQASARSGHRLFRCGDDDDRDGKRHGDWGGKGGKEYLADVRELGGLLQRANLALPVADVDRLTVRYPSALALMRELKAMGLANALTARRRRLVSRMLLARAAAVYEETFSDPDGRVRATFDLVTLTAWAPAGSQQKPLKPGSATSRLADALGTTEHKLKR